MDPKELTEKIAEVLSNTSADESNTLAQRILAVVFPSLEEGDKPPLMDDQHVEWAGQLLGDDYEMKPGTGKFAQVEDEVLYVRPPTYGERRYHMVSLSYTNGLIIEQTDHSEKYQQRVTFEEEEFAPVLRQLLQWWLNKIRPGQAEAEKINDEFGSF